MKVGGGKPRSVSNPVIQALRQYMKANQNYRRHYQTILGGEPHPMAISMGNLSRSLGNKPKPHNKNTAQKLAFVRRRGRTYLREGPTPRLPWSKAAKANTKARQGVSVIFGRDIGRNNVHRLLTLAEVRAARTIARALSSNAVMKRVQNRRRTRNFIGAELSMYRPNANNRLIRPSNVKAGRFPQPSI
jgi:hypothetical protein